MKDFTFAEWAKVDGYMAEKHGRGWTDRAKPADARQAAGVCKADDCARVTRPEDEGYCATHFRRYRMWGPSLTPPPV